MRPYSLAFALLLFLGLGCESPAEPTRPDAFVAATRRQDPAPLQAHSVGVADLMVIVDGHIFTADPCHGFAATTLRRGRTLTVTLHARPNSVGCLAPLTDWNYRITVPNVPPGA